MKKAAPLAFIFVVALCMVNPSRVLAQQFSVRGSPVTLYSDIKYRGEHRQGCLSLLTGASYSIWSARNPCDLYYGLLYAGDEKDWLQSSAAQGNRSVIKDLGLLDWTTTSKVPPVAPLSKLKPGEQRHITVDTSGADGADGAPGRPGQNGADADGVVRETSGPEPPSRAPLAIPSRPKNDGRPKVDPLFVKAVTGHLYVIHVVDDVSDFYALFRVEALERGDHCTISWKLIPAPDSEATQRK